MVNKPKIPVRELVEDLTGGRLPDAAIMERYGLNHRAFVYVLGKLAKKRKISFKKVVSFIGKYLKEDNVEYAESCLRVIEKYCTEVWGVQTMIKGLEHDLLETKKRLEFKRDMENPSKSLVWFGSEYPDAFLHPAIGSSVSIFEKYAQKTIDEDSGVVATRAPFDAQSRLKLYSEYVPFFKKYGPAEAVRMWHYISVVLFARHGVENFVVKGRMDAATCDVCMHLDGTRMSVAKVRAAAGEPEKRGLVLPVKPFPVPIDVEGLSKDEKEGVLIQNGWFLPPFCEKCRCQIFPFI